MSDCAARAHRPRSSAIPVCWSCRLTSTPKALPPRLNRGRRFFWSTAIATTSFRRRRCFRRRRAWPHSIFRWSGISLPGSATASTERACVTAANFWREGLRGSGEKLPVRVIASQRVRPEVAGPMTSSVKRSSPVVRKLDCFVANAPRYDEATSKHRKIDRLVPVERAADRRQRIFEPGGAIEQQRLLAFFDATIGEALLVGRIGRRAFRAQQQTFFARRLVQRLCDRLVGDRDGKAAAL